MVIGRSLFGMIAIGAAILGSSAASAQNDPIAARKAAMEAVGDQNSIATQMLNGKQPYSTEAAKKVFDTFANSATRMPGLFPEDSKSGDTKALPAIWEKREDFNARLAKFAEQSKAAATKVTDLASFKVAIGEVRRNCGGCHKPYRAR